MNFSIYQLKSRFQQLLQPVLAGLARRGITPNHVTVLALVLSLLYGAALASFPHEWRLWAGLPFVMLLRMALNAIDGMLANFTQNKTRLGAILNEIGDQISDAALVLPFALVGGIHAPLLVIVALTALLAEFAGVLAAVTGEVRRFDGPMGKSDRALAFSVLAILIASGSEPSWINGLLLLILILLGWTVWNRLRPGAR